MNHEIRKNLKQIRRQCTTRSPTKYSSYCHRPTLDLANVLGDMIKEHERLKEIIANLVLNLPESYNRITEPEPC